MRGLGARAAAGGLWDAVLRSAQLLKDTLRAQVEKDKGRADPREAAAMCVAACMCAG